LTASFHLPVVSNVGCDGRHQATCRIFPIEPVSHRKYLKVLATAFKAKEKNKQMHRRLHSSHIPHKPCNTHFSRLESTFQRRLWNVGYGNNTFKFFHRHEHNDRLREIMFDWHRALTAEQITNSSLLKMLFEIRA